VIRRLLPFFAFVALSALLYAGIRLSQERDPNAIPSPLIDKPAPEFALPALHQPDQLVRKSDLLGQPYLLNVFASWCPSCRVEHPVISELARSGRLKVIGFNYKDQREDALRWLQQFGDPYAQILVDADGRAGIDLGVYGAPESFLIGADGKVLHKHVGPVTAEVIEQELLPLLQGAQP
jgi:cytochrome c biogenesis protein CcmG/thiol:disulfide interchange protein DsbE